MCVVGAFLFGGGGGGGEGGGGGGGGGGGESGSFLVFLISTLILGINLESLNIDEVTLLQRGLTV